MGWTGLVYIHETFGITKGFEVKGPFHLETNDFNQQTACGAPIFWSKYTTHGTMTALLF